MMYPALPSTLYYNFKQLRELSGLCAAGEAADGRAVGIGRGEAIGLPAAVMMEQEAVHLLFVVGRQPGARLGDGLLQASLVATDTEDGLLYGQRLEKLRRHNTLRTVGRGAIGEQQQDGALVEHIGHSRGGHHAGVVHEGRAGVARGLLFDDAPRVVVGEPADAERLGCDLTLGGESGDGTQQ